MKAKGVALLSVICVILSSCIKEELAVPAPPPVDAIEGKVCLSPTYREQVYFDIGTNAVVSSNHKEDWDLGFSSDPSDSFLVLNNARLMRAAVTSYQQFDQIIDTLALAGQFKVDVSSGDKDSLAIDVSTSIGRVIVLDMGYNHIGLHLGMYKLKVDNIDPLHYFIRYAPLQYNGPATSTLVVDRDPSKTMVHASVINDQQVSVEPDAGSFDLLFTQYTVYFADPGLEYIVTGVLSARDAVRVSEFENVEFDSVQLVDTLMNPMSSNLDVIGYDWKDYDFDLSLFITDPTRVFIVQDAARDFYKMRFVDFYSSTGQKGCPRFEVVGF